MVTRNDGAKAQWWRRGCLRNDVAERGGVSFIETKETGFDSEPLSLSLVMVIVPLWLWADGVCMMLGAMMR